jgi:hypothetical protein
LHLTLWAFDIPTAPEFNARALANDAYARRSSLCPLAQAGEGAITSATPYCCSKQQISVMELSSEKIARMRQQYVDGVPVAQILAENKVSQRVFYYWLDGGPRDPARRLPPIPRRQAPRRDGKDSAAARRQLVARLWGAAERQMDDIEQRLKGVGQESTERERDARALAVLVKTLRELVAFDETHPAAATRTDSEDDDAGPRDIDEFRRELARKMDVLVARREARIRGEADCGDS